MDAYDTVFWGSLLVTSLLLDVALLIAVAWQHSRMLAQAAQEAMAMSVELALGSPGRFEHEWANDAINTAVTVRVGGVHALLLLFGWQIRLVMITETEMAQKQVDTTDTTVTWVSPKWWPSKVLGQKGWTAP